MVRPRALTGGDAHVDVTVSNVGDPLPDGALSELFEPYRRASSRRSRTGLGLGLFIVREIARAHGGDVEARSVEDRVEFTIRVPRQPPAGATH